MYCEVQLLYCRGAKVRQFPPPVRGELTLHILRNGSNRDSVRLRADLTGPNRGPAVPFILNAMVIKISAGGIVLTGTEVVPRSSSPKANVEYYKQTWWCRMLPGEMAYLQEKKVQEMPQWQRATRSAGQTS